MNTTFKTAGISAFAVTGLQRLLHETIFRNELTILMYHAVVRSPLAVPESSFLDETSFRRQMRYLKNNLEVISLSAAIQRLKAGGVKRPTAVITFDDGFQNNYDVAFPILREERLPATIFLTTGFVNTQDAPWFCRLHGALIATCENSFAWDGREFDLRTPEARLRTYIDIRETLKRLSHDELVKENRSIIQRLGDDPDRPIGLESPFRMLTRQAILDMAASGLIEFGAHTVSHPILSRLSSTECREEVDRSIRAVAELTQQSCESFAYPNGGALDFNQESIRILESCGARAAVTGVFGPNNSATPIMALRRYSVTAGMSLAHFKLIVHHLVYYVRRSIQQVHTPLQATGEVL